MRLHGSNRDVDVHKISIWMFTAGRIADRNHHGAGLRLIKATP